MESASDLRRSALPAARQAAPQWSPAAPTDATAAPHAAPRGPRGPRGAPRWGLTELTGRLVDLAGQRASAVYSSALSLVADAQRSNETAVWVGPRSRSFFPPDAERAGVDLAALPVVRVPHERDLPVAADLLARSGAFGLIVLDLGGASLALGVLSRLAGLARAHGAAIVLLTEKSPERPSLGSVVSFRADSSFQRTSAGTFAHALVVTRDRTRPAGWRVVEVRHGPPGLS